MAQIAWKWLRAGTFLHLNQVSLSLLCDVEEGGVERIKIEMVKGERWSIPHKNKIVNIQGTMQYLTKTNDKKHDDTLEKLCLFVLAQ